MASEDARPTDNLTEIAELRARLARSIEQALRREFAQGTGEDSIRRAFAAVRGR